MNQKPNYEGDFASQTPTISLYSHSGALPIDSLAFAKEITFVVTYFSHIWHYSLAAQII